VLQQQRQDDLSHGRKMNTSLECACLCPFGCVPLRFHEKVSTSPPALLLMSPPAGWKGGWFIQSNHVEMWHISRVVTHLTSPGLERPRRRVPAA